MFEIEHVEQWRGQDVIDPDGERLGKLEEVYFAGDGPALFAVRSGAIRKRTNLIPLGGVVFARDWVRVGARKADIEAAPDVAADGTISRGDGELLAEHYKLEVPAPPADEDAYEGSQARAERLAELQARIERAEQLEAEAARKAAAADEASRQAGEASDAAKAAELERKHAQDEAAAARRAADE